MRQSKLLRHLLSIFLLAVFAPLITAAQNQPELSLKELGIKKYEGSTVIGSISADYAKLEMTEQVKPTGRVARFLYSIPESISSLDVIENYQTALKEQGYEIVLSNEGRREVDACKIFTAAPTLVKFPDVCISYYLESINCRQLVAKKDLSGNQTVYARVATTSFNQKIKMIPSQSGSKVAQETNPDIIYVGVDIVVPKDLDRKMVEDQSTISKALAEKGRVDLYGIYFDFDKDSLKPESKPVIDAIAKVLEHDLSLRLEVVGHTDAVGTAAHNDDLSRRRAEAVIKALITDYKIDAARLTAVGKGATQPVAPNETDEGRAKNRRVELVKKS